MNRILVVMLTLVLILSFILAGCSSSTPTPTTTVPPTTKPPITTTATTTTAVTTTSTVTTTTTTTTTAPTTPVNTTPIKIGAIMSMTGESALVGPGEKEALQYRLNQIGNQIAGRPIQLIIDDDASSPTTSVDAVKKQLLLDKVDVIIGPTMGAAAVAAGNFMKTANPAIPIFIIMAKSGKLLENVPGNNVYLPMGTDLSTGYYLGLYAADTLKYKTTTLLLEDMISGYEKVQDGFLPAFKKQGGSSVQQQTVKSGTVDFSPFLAALKPADCVTFWFTPGLTSRFVAQYYAAGKTMPLLIPDSSVLLSKPLTGIGAKAVGIVSEINYTTLIDTPMNQAYVADYAKKMNGNLPTTQGGAMDQSLLIYLEAVKATGGDTSPDKINAAIRKISMDTPAGHIAFTPQGMGIGDLYIAQSVQLADRIDWKPIFDYKQMVLDIPK